MPKFIIKDWADNTCFKGIEFESFDNAWAYLMDKFPDDITKDLDEYHVIEIK